MDPLNPGINWNGQVNMIPDDQTFADWYPGRGVAILFFFNPELQTSFPEIWTAIQNGWSAAYGNDMTAEQLKVPISSGRTDYDYTPEQNE
jgi:hypothetical protein